MSCLHIEIPDRMPMLLGFGAENQFETRFFMASISFVFCVLGFIIETLLNWNQRALGFSSIRQIEIAW
jgi:hypothetical protein